MTSTHPGLPEPGPASRHFRPKGGSPWRIRSARPPWLEARQSGPWEIRSTDHCHDRDDEGPHRPADAGAPAEEAQGHPTVSPLLEAFVKALPGSPEATSLEHGDRERFLAAQRPSVVGAAGPDLARPAYRPNGTSGELPRPRLVTDPSDDDGQAAPEALAQMFARAVERGGGHCHRVDETTGEVPDTLLDRLVAEHEAWDVVVTGEPEARALSRRLCQRGAEVRPATRQAARRAALGITSARAGIAATGSLVLDSSSAGGRVASVLPPVHICVLPTDRLVATPSDVLRPLGDGNATLPPSLVLVTAPACPGHVDRLLTVGAHGPRELHVILL